MDLVRLLLGDRILPGILLFLIISLFPTATPVVTESPTPVVTPTPTPIATQPLQLVSESTAIAPVTPTPAATPAPQSKTPDSEDFQLPKIPPLANPDIISDRILTIDRSITSQLPPSIVASSPESKQPQTVNPISNLVLGYTPPPDRLLEEKNLGKTIWGIETIRNQEFGEYLGVKGQLPEQNVLISQFQQTLQTIQQKTGKRSGIIYLISRDEKLEIILVPPVGQPIHYSVTAANRAALFPVVKKLRDEITNPRKLNTTSYLAAAQQLYKWSIATLEKNL